MTSVRTPHTHTAVTAEEIAVTFKSTAFRFHYDLVVPAGTRCVKLEGGSAPWVIDDLAFISDTKSFLYHDASHHGIPIDENKLTNIAAIGKTLGHGDAQTQRGTRPQPEDDSPAP